MGTVHTLPVVSPALVRTTDDLVTYSVTDAAIEKTREACHGLTADTPEGYEAVRIAIGNLRSTRVAIEKRRVELKADALAFGRKVDAEAKRLTGLIEAIEQPLAEKKQAIDDAKARAKAEAEAEKLRALQAEIEANLARQEEERRAKQAEEAAKLAADRAALEAERQQLAAARAAQEAEEARQRAVLDAEEDRLHAAREALEVERRRVEQARQQAERAEFERQAQIKAEADAKAKAERERVAAEEARIAQAERQAAAAARLEALKPDADKVAAFASLIRAVPVPAIADEQLRGWIDYAVLDLTLIAERLEGYITTTVIDAESFS